jgi:hypothetical protein
VGPSRTALGAYVRSVTAGANAEPTTGPACALAPERDFPPSPGGRSVGMGRMRTPGGRRAATSDWKDLGEKVRGSWAGERERAGAAGGGSIDRNLGEPQSALHP